MTEINVEYNDNNLAIENEIVNSDNDQVETGIIDDVDDETTRSDANEAENADGDDTEDEIVTNDNVEDNSFNEEDIVTSDTSEDGPVIIDDTEGEIDSDDEEANTSTNGDIETENAASDHNEDGTESNDDAEDEPSASEKSEEEIGSDYDTELESGNSDGTNTEIVGSDLTEPDTEDSKITEAEIASDVAEEETASSENAEAGAGDEEIATGIGDEAETSINDNPEIKLVKGGVFVPVYSDERELLGFAEMKYPDCFEDQDAPTDKVPDNLPEEPHNEEETESGILEGIESSLDVSEDKGGLLGNTELEQALHAKDGEDSTEVENGNNGKAEFSLPEGVTEAPRNNEEINMGSFKDNPKVVQVYLGVSDDKGELLGNTDLEQQVKEFCERYSKPVEDTKENHEKALAAATIMLIAYTQQLNMVDSRLSGTIAKYRIRQGIMLNILKRLVKGVLELKWTKWFKANFDGRQFRTAQVCMQVAQNARVIGHAFLGMDRLIQIDRQLTDADRKTDDPVGTFIARNGIDYNPEEQVDEDDLKLKTDIAINHQKCLNVGLDIPKGSIEALVRLGKDVEPKDIRELQIRKDAGQDIVEEFKKMVATGGKLPPLQTPKRKAEGFNKSTVQFIKKVESAIKDREYLGEFKADLITRLKEKVQQLEQMLQAITEESPEPPNDEDDSSQAPTEGEGLI